MMAVYKAKQGKAGFTLIEIMVAVAVFSLMTILAWRGLDGLLIGRTVINQQTENSQELRRFMRQLELDIGRLVASDATLLPVLSTTTQGLIILRTQTGDTAGMLYQWVRYSYIPNDKTIERAAITLPAQTYLHTLLYLPSATAFDNVDKVIIANHVDAVKWEGFQQNWVTIFANSDSSKESQQLRSKADFKGVRVSLTHNGLAYNKTWAIGSY